MAPSRRYSPFELHVGVNCDSHLSVEFPIDPAKPQDAINQLNKQLNVKQLKVICRTVPEMGEDGKEEKLPVKMNAGNKWNM